MIALLGNISCHHTTSFVKGNSIKVVDSEKKAISVVLDSMKDKEAASEKSEWSASLKDGVWAVWAFDIVHPEREGSGRFVPGGYTIYKVDRHGKILEKVPGF